MTLWPMTSHPQMPDLTSSPGRLTSVFPLTRSTQSCWGPPWTARPLWPHFRHSVPKSDIYPICILLSLPISILLLFHQFNLPLNIFQICEYYFHLHINLVQPPLSAGWTAAAVDKLVSLFYSCCLVIHPPHNSQVILQDYKNLLEALQCFSIVHRAQVPYHVYRDGIWHLPPSWTTFHTTFPLPIKR